MLLKLSQSGFLKLRYFTIALVFLSFSGNATEALELTWESLRPVENILQKKLNRSESNEPELSSPSVGGLPSDAVVPELDGKRVRIPAFVVPLDGDNESLTEMLLVPYFGACVHVPAPPPNQIIYIESDKAVDVSKLDLYDPVWAVGTLRTESTQHEIAQIGYRMDIERLEPYVQR